MASYEKQASALKADTKLSNRKNIGLTPNACTQCRKVKMKCIFRDGHTVCERCTRLKLDCIRQRHHRGRKLGTRLKSSTTVSVPQALQLRSPVSASLIVDEAMEKATTAGAGPPLSAVDISNNDHEEIPLLENRRDHDVWPGDRWTDVNGFQPPDLLHKHEAKGRFSLQIILDAASDVTPTTCSDESTQSDEDIVDPIALGILNLAVASSLFENFMQKFNPWICQFDVDLHTFDYVRGRSSLLLTAILASAAKAFNPLLKRPLQIHTESLFSRTFTRGIKSVDVVHAVLVMMNWKEPEDTRAWMLVGHAIRLGHELGWHRLRLKDLENKGTLTETRRALRDVERVWLLLFVFDRNLSFQTGNPWMIERSKFLLEARDRWYQDPLATHSDSMLCALVDLRLLTSDTFRPSHLQCYGHRSGESQFDQRGSLVRIILHDVDKWQKQWSRVSAIASEGCHRFLLRFYGAHLRLLLSSIPLESSFASASAMKSIDKRALWLSFSSATDMLSTLIDDEIQSSLYFVPDSVHVETAYAAAFLVQLCLQLPPETSGELEATVKESLHQGLRTFQHQNAPLNTGCALQANFLANILHMFKRAMHCRQQCPQPPLSLSRLDQSHTKPWQAGPSDKIQSVLQQNRITGNPQPLPGDVRGPGPIAQTPPKSKGGRPHTPSAGSGVTIQDFPADELSTAAACESQREQLQQSGTVATSTGVPAEQLVTAEVYGLGDSETGITGTEDWPGVESAGQSFEDSQDFLHDDDAWVTMFTNAGFSIVSGTFMPNIDC